MTPLHDLADRLEGLAREVRAEADRAFGLIQSFATSPNANPTPANDAADIAAASEAAPEFAPEPTPLPAATDETGNEPVAGLVAEPVIGSEPGGAPAPLAPNPPASRPSGEVG